MNAYLSDLFLLAQDDCPSFVERGHGDRFRSMVLAVLGTARQLGMSTAGLMRQVCALGLANKPVNVRFPIPAQEPQHLH